MISFTRRTALHQAVIFNNFNTVKYLISQNVNLNKIDNFGMSALDYAT